jgi:hypothetical protein
MRGCLKIASWAIVLPLIVFAALAFWALRGKLPAAPPLPGTVERGALEHGGRPGRGSRTCPRSRGRIRRW